MYIIFVIGIHEKSFITFICASELNMVISSVLLKKGRITKTLMTKLEMRSLKYKICLTAFNMCCFAIGGYCFLRHNAYCESGGTYPLCIRKNEHFFFIYHFLMRILL